MAVPLPLRKAGVLPSKRLKEKFLNKKRVLIDWLCFPAGKEVLKR